MIALLEPTIACMFSPSTLPIKLIVRPSNLRDPNAEPSIMNLAGTKRDFEIAHRVVFIDNFGDETNLKRTSITAEDDELYHIIERPITKATRYEEIQPYLESLCKLLRG